MSRSARVLALTLLPACTVFDALSFTPDGGAEASAPVDDAGGNGGADTGPDGGDAPPANRYASAVLEDAPLAYYRFEDRATVASDSSGRGHDCEYVGVIGREPASASASLGAAIHLPGNVASHVLCSDDPFDFTGSVSLSLEAWVRPRVIDSIYRRIVSKDVKDPRAGYSLSVVQPDLVRAERYAGGAEVCGVTAPIARDTWTHVVATFDGTTLRLYVDGNLVRDDCTTAPLPDTATRMTIGVQSDRNYGPFDGAIDEVAVYGHELPGNRVAAHRAAR
jgi:hypothetical protein